MNDNHTMEAERTAMVKTQLLSRDIHDKWVLQAMDKVPRHLFVPESLQAYAYEDGPLDIGDDQTISQPYMVAYMTQALALSKEAKVLEIGTGSGYQAAILSKIVKDVFTIEIVPSLGKQAEQTLQSLGYQNIHTRIADGYYGWPEEAPFDGILMAAAPLEIPEPLLAQLKTGSHLIMPIGPAGDQTLIRLTKTKKGITETKLMGVRFVPMTRSK